MPRHDGHAEQRKATPTMWRQDLSAHRRSHIIENDDGKLAIKDMEGLRLVAVAVGRELRAACDG